MYFLGNSNPCYSTFVAGLGYLNSNAAACISVIEPSYSAVALAALSIACAADDAQPALGSCIQAYGSVDAIWTCGPVDKLGCCWSAVLEYVQIVWGTDIHDRIVNGASSSQNNCKPSGATCRSTSGAVATTLRSGYRLALAAVTIAGAATSLLRQL